MSDMDPHQSTDEPRFIFLACSWSPVIFLDLSLVKAESLLLASETLISCFPSEWYVNYAFNGLKVLFQKVTLAAILLILIVPRLYTFTFQKSYKNVHASLRC